MDLIGEERGRLARAASWLDASPVEVAGLAVLLSGSLLATLVLVWTALGRPALPSDDAPTPNASDHAAPVPEDADDPLTAGTAPGSADAGRDPVASDDGQDPDGSDRDTPTEVTVHVAGAVTSPGLVTVGAGARVADAVDAAGGLADDADLARINLAQPLVDGEQVVVLREGEDAPAGASGSGGDPLGGGDGQPAGPIDLNRADAGQLESLPGIGPTLAQRIVRHRDEHGPFQAPGDIRDVSGIGEKRFQDLADLVTVG